MIADLPPISVVEGHSLGIGMRPVLEHKLTIKDYDVKGGRLITEGVDRLLAKNIRGKYVFVMLGANDFAYSTYTSFRREIRQVVNRVGPDGCIVWGNVRLKIKVHYSQINRAIYSFRSKHFRIPRSPWPDTPDGIHMKPATYRKFANNYIKEARKC